MNGKQLLNGPQEQEQSSSSVADEAEKGSDPEDLPQNGLSQQIDAAAAAEEEFTSDWSPEKLADQSGISVSEREDLEEGEEFNADGVAVDSQILREKSMEERMKEAGLVDIQSIDKSIQVDLKYASNDNFLSQNMYGSLRKAYLQKDVAKMLARANQKLRELHPRYTFVVYDACRPVAVQQQLRERADEIGKARYVAKPGSSMHNYGAAVDLSILDELGNAIDMATDFDFFGELAEPRHELRLLHAGEITQEQIDNRELLRQAMKHGGFHVMMTEWWHFNAGARTTIVEKYDLVR